MINRTQAFDVENEKRDILQDCVNDYVTNIYRVKKFSFFFLIKFTLFLFRQIQIPKKFGLQLLNSNQKIMNIKKQLAF